MSLPVVFSLLMFVCVARCWNLDPSARFLSLQEPQLRPSLTLNRPQCFGLSRRSRQVKINLPVLSNSRTRQVSPVPRFLYAADESLVARLESEGWEIRANSIYIPQVVYERVPVCCPWDPNCDQATEQQPTAGRSSESPAACSNGGQLIYRDGQQRCECPPGYQGSLCQMSDGTEENQPNSSSPTNPLVRTQSHPGQYPDMLREADVWRLQTLQSPVSPMLSLKDHVLTAVARPWGYRSAVLQQQQTLLRKMAQMEEMYRQVQDWYGHTPMQTLPQYNAREAMSAWGSNPYNIIDSRSGGPSSSVRQANVNPYNAIPSQAQLPPNMARAFSAVQEQLGQKPGQKPAVNPYSLSQGVPSLDTLALVQRTKNEQGGVNPYSRQPERVDVPQARTPWDLDPFGQQQNPSYMNDPGVSRTPSGDRQVMLMTLYQQLLNQQSGRLSDSNEARNSPAVSDPRFPSPVLSSSFNGGDQPAPLPASPALDNSIQSAKEVEMSNPRGTQTVEQNPTPINGHQAMPVAGEDTSEMVKQIERCQQVLTPKLNRCLNQYQLTMEQFMNPQNMEKSRAVCQASQSVGLCIMQHDRVCGEGDAILTTRKMINSVLHMMGMICQQIAIRGQRPIMRGPMGRQFGPLGAASVPESGLPKQPPKSGLPAGKLSEPPALKDGAEKLGQASPNDPTRHPSDMDSPQDGHRDPEKPVSKEPAVVSRELRLFGYPLWLIITLAVVLLVALLLFLMVVYLCCKRCHAKKFVVVEKKIEKVPAPLNSKICTIDVPPPSYTTAALQQNEDGLVVSPLDIKEDSVKVSVDDDINKKHPLDEDADDESSEKDDEENAKK